MKLKRNEKRMNDLFGFGEIRNIADAIINRAEWDIAEYTNDPYEAIMDAVNDELIYTTDRWEVMKAYQDPQNANWGEAVEEFLNDLNLCVEVYEEYSNGIIEIR